MPAPTPEQLAWLREHSGLSIDAAGFWRHQGEPILHEGLAAALWRGLRPGEGGRLVVQIGDEWAYVDAPPEPFVVRSARWEGARFVMLLSDRTEEVLDPATLWLGADGVLRCRVRGGTLGARFSRAAQVALGEMAEEEGAAVVVRAGAEKWRVR